MEGINQSCNHFEKIAIMFIPSSTPLIHDIKVEWIIETNSEGTIDQCLHLIIFPSIHLTNNVTHVDLVHFT